MRLYYYTTILTNVVEIMPQHEHAEIEGAKMTAQLAGLKEQLEGLGGGSAGAGDAAGALIAQAPWLISHVHRHGRVRDDGRGTSS